LHSLSNFLLLLYSLYYMFFSIQWLFLTWPLTTNCHNLSATQLFLDVILSLRLLYQIVYWEELEGTFSQWLLWSYISFLTILYCRIILNGHISILMLCWTKLRRCSLWTKYLACSHIFVKSYKLFSSHTYKIFWYLLQLIFTNKL